MIDVPPRQVFTAGDEVELVNPIAVAMVDEKMEQELGCDQTAEDCGVALHKTTGAIRPRHIDPVTECLYQKPSARV